jgi:hypothetical protein
MTEYILYKDYINATGCLNAISHYLINSLIKCPRLELLVAYLVTECPVVTKLKDSSPCLKDSSN